MLKKTHRLTKRWEQLGTKTVVQNPMGNEGGEVEPVVGKDNQRKNVLKEQRKKERELTPKPKGDRELRQPKNKGRSVGLRKTPGARQETTEAPTGLTKKDPKPGPPGKKGKK